MNIQAIGVWFSQFSFPFVLINFDLVLCHFHSTLRNLVIFHL